MTVFVVTLLASIAFCWFYLSYARRKRWLDDPNERSSHTRSTPHGGGLGIFAAFALGLILYAVQTPAFDAQLVPLLLATFILVFIGWFDDLSTLSIALRFSMYAVLSVAVVIWMSMGSPSGIEIWQLPFAVLFLLWLLNLFNFMDGIDGLAATQCFLACACSALLVFVTSGPAAYAAVCFILALAHLGFLFFNWPPARLFMGDAGSVPTGFLLGALALYGEVNGLLPLACWLVLLAAFITDATYTLLWRFITGQPVTQPHRLHLYQRLSRYWGSHLRVDILLLALNAFWLFPLAWAISIWPQHQFILVILAYIPLLLSMAKWRFLT
ncbi:MAG: glycosyltransferase family 4 protein [Halioglobus sp.]